MESIAALMAKSRATIKIGETAYKMYPLTADDFGKLQEWVDSQFKNPFVVMREEFDRDPEWWNSARQQYAIKLAMERSIAGPPKIGTPAADLLVNTQEGTAQTMYLSVSKGDPSFTIEDARAAVALANDGTRSDIFFSTDVGQVLHDPKGSRPTGKRSGNSTPRRRRKAKAGSTGTSSSTRP